MSVLAGVLIGLLLAMLALWVYDSNDAAFTYRRWPLSQAESEYLAREMHKLAPSITLEMLRGCPLFMHFLKVTEAMRGGRRTSAEDIRTYMSIAFAMGLNHGRREADGPG